MMSAVFPRSLFRPALYCATALVAALVYWGFAAHDRGERQTRLATLRETNRQLAAQLETARQDAARRAHLDERLAALLAAYGNHGNQNDRDDAPWLRPLRRIDSRRAADIVVHAQPRASPPSLPAAAGLPALDMRRLRVEARLLHEFVLPELVEAWTHAPGAHAIARACTLRRADGDGLPPIAAHCVFDWITLVPPEGMQATH
jgi:hypothetical protein